MKMLQQLSRKQQILVAAVASVFCLIFYFYYFDDSAEQEKAEKQYFKLMQPPPRENPQAYKFLADLRDADPKNVKFLHDVRDQLHIQEHRHHNNNKQQEENQEHEQDQPHHDDRGHQIDNRDPKADDLESNLQKKIHQHDSEQSKKRRRYFLISFVDDEKVNVGLMYGALSRSCYANMHSHRGYHSVFYSQKDLVGYAWKERDKLSVRAALDRALMWSKSVLILKTFDVWNLTQDDWVFWLDGDTVITDPRITLEQIIESASTTTTDGNEPDVIVSNSNDGINAGIIFFRATDWSRNFLHKWWSLRHSTAFSLDNGVLFSALLEAIAEENNVVYKGECDATRLGGKAVDEWAGENGLAACFQRYVREKLCHGDVKGCVSRVPHSNKSVDIPWKPGSKLGRDYEYGFLMQKNGKHVGYHPRNINEGNGVPGREWVPCAVFSERSFLLHSAGTTSKERNKWIRHWTKQFSHRFSPRCF